MHPEHAQPKGQGAGWAAREQGGSRASSAAPDEAHVMGAHGAAQGSTEDPDPSRAGRGGGLHAAPGAVGQGPTVTFSVLRADGSFVGFQCARRPGIVHASQCLTGVSAVDLSKLQVNYSGRALCKQALW